MSQRNPASLIIDINGNLVGVLYDGTVYRLQVDTTISDKAGNIAEVEIMGNREGLAVSYPELLASQMRIEAALDKINAQLADITGEDDPL
jgi:hypothetical protein